MIHPDENDIDDFLDVTLSEMERRADLERARTFGVRVEVDLTDENTTLAKYVAHVRAGAMQALLDLALCDASNPLVITRHQSVIRQYLDVSAWARGVIEASKAADEILRETHGDD